MSYYFNDYETEHPNVVIDILEFFYSLNTTDGSIKEKTVQKFCEKYNFKYQPEPINRICKRLCDCCLMSVLYGEGGLLGLHNIYITSIDVREMSKDEIVYSLNSRVYGFEYIYNLYKTIVVPLVGELENGDLTVGTGFYYKNGIVTAKHCVSDVTNIQIKGYTAEELKECPIYISENEEVDLAFIETGKNSNPILIDEDGEVMQEVIVMGYPKIPGFTQFLTVEKATISSKASARITPTKGSIAAYGYEYLTKINAMLITARIRGGNSGGPVINQNGCLVGIACHIPNTDSINGDYDDLGYGVAVPVSCLREIIEKKNKRLFAEIEFRDFIE